MPSANSSARLVIFFSILALSCVLVAFVSVRLIAPERWAQDEIHGHQWLHNQLDLTSQEAESIDVFEGPYQAERQRLLQEFDNRIQELAQQLESESSFSSEVDQALERVHDAHGELQRLSIEHYFDMLQTLPEDKQRKLRALAVEALSTPE